MNKTDKEEILRVASTTNASSLAAAITKVVQQGTPFSLMAVGAASVNQAVKAIAIANRLLGSSGVSLSVMPCFSTIDISGEKRLGQEDKSEITAIKFKVLTNK